MWPVIQLKLWLSVRKEFPNVLGFLPLQKTVQEHCVFRCSLSKSIGKLWPPLFIVTLLSWFKLEIHARFLSLNKLHCCANHFTKLAIAFAWWLLISSGGKPTSWTPSSSTTPWTSQTSRGLHRTSQTTQPSLVKSDLLVLFIIRNIHFFRVRKKSIAKKQFCSLDWQF